MGEIQSDSSGWRISEWFPDISDSQNKQLKVYFDSFLAANKTFALLPSKYSTGIDSNLFADSILSSRIIFKSVSALKEIYDFSGSPGFPGLVMAILYPEVKVNILAPEAKKFDFLRQTVLVLGLTNVNLIQKSIEGLPDSSVQVAVIRGVNTITRNLLNCRKSLTKGGVLFHIKGEEWGLEVSEIPTQLCSIWTPSLVSDYKLPVGALKFSVVKTDKIQ
ncbi:MAG: RsmG family class I SAM-dependent methyltransferase [Bdellovibrionia bacterium]